MPTYEYECSKCGDRFEVFQRMDEPAPARCKRCKGELKKVFFPVGIVFKGSGFYATDNRKSACAAGGGNGKSSPKPDSEAACKSCDKKCDTAGGDSGGSAKDTGAGSTAAE